MCSAILLFYACCVKWCRQNICLLIGKKKIFYECQGLWTPTMMQCANVSFDPGCIIQLICRMNKQPGGHCITLSDTVVCLTLLNGFVRPKSLNDWGEHLHVFTKIIWTVLYWLWLYSFVVTNFCCYIDNMKLQIDCF